MGLIVNALQPVAGDVRVDLGRGQVDVAEQFEAESSVLPEFERAIKLEEGVVRFLVVLLEGEMPAAVPATAVGAEEDDE